MLNYIKMEMRYHKVSAKAIVLVLGIFCLYGFIEGKGYSLSGTILSINYVFLITVAEAEEKNKFYMIINSLPIKRKGVVLAKYILGFLYMVLAVVFSMLFSRIVNCVNFSCIQKAEYFNICMGLIISFIYYIVIYPFVFTSIGITIKRILYVFLYIILFALSFAMEKGQNYTLGFIGEFCNIYNALYIYLVIVVLLILYLVSYFISLKIYNNRELS